MMRRNKTIARDYETEEMSNRFWNSVDSRLKEAKMSRTDLGRKANLSAQSLTSAKYLKSNINIFTALRITEAFGCTIEDLIYDSSEISEVHRAEEYASLIKEVKEEADSDGVSKLVELFGKLREDEQEAVLIHALSILGIRPKTTMAKIEETKTIGDER